MNDVKLSKDFRPCYSSKPQDAISMGPGVSVGELYDFTSTHGVVTTGGYTNTVGAGGGFILGGGTGNYCPSTNIKRDIPLTVHSS